MINPAELKLLQRALETLAEGYVDLPELTPDFDVEAAGKVLQVVAKCMQNKYTYYHPRYAGQTL